MRALPLVLAGALLAPLGASCIGTTGGDLVTFNAAAAGPADAVAGAPLTFRTGRGFNVSLTSAKLHVGAVYLDSARPISGAQETDCILPGLYVAEVTQGFDVDVLSPTPQPFPQKGEATASPAAVGQVWFNHGDVNALEDATPVLVLEGTATNDAGKSYPFQGSLTIAASNRVPPSNDPSQPNLHPVCKERIVADIELGITPTKGGSMLLRIDPRGWFTNVDFSKLTKVSDSPLLYQFDDSNDTQPDVNLYRGVHSNSGVYQITWINSSTP